MIVLTWTIDTAAELKLKYNSFATPAAHVGVLNSARQFASLKAARNGES